MRILTLLLATSLTVTPSAHAQVEGAPSGVDMGTSGLLLPDTTLIDIPTASALDLGGFQSRTRFFSSGGFLETLGFGVYPRVNLGVSFNVDRLVGNDSPVQIRRPELNMKIRFFDGDRLIPAFAMGFNGQGYFYNKPSKTYNQKQRGLYFVGSQEIGLPGLQAHAGMNIWDFDSNGVGGFLASSLNIRDRVKLMVEWDNLNSIFDSRFNSGLRVYMTPNFNFDFAVRGIGQGGRHPDGQPRDPERVMQFKYIGHF